jgi:hypothetical protein
LSRKATFVASAEAMARARARVTLGHCALHGNSGAGVPSVVYLRGERGMDRIGYERAYSSAECASNSKPTKLSSPTTQPS